MSTKKTTNYKLHQWEPTDDFLRREFNENFGKLDTVIQSGLAAIDAQLKEKAEYVIGTYLGQQTTLDLTTRHIALGFRPKVVILGNAEHLSYTGVLAIDKTTSGTHRMEIEDNGFLVINCSAYYTDQKGQCYVYIAFR